MISELCKQIWNILLHNLRSFAVQPIILYTVLSYAKTELITKTFYVFECLVRVSPGMGGV